MNTENPNPIVENIWKRLEKIYGSFAENDLFQEFLIDCNPYFAPWNTQRDQQKNNFLDQLRTVFSKCLPHPQKTDLRTCEERLNLLHFVWFLPSNRDINFKNIILYLNLQDCSMPIENLTIQFHVMGIFLIKTGEKAHSQIPRRSPYFQMLNLDKFTVTTPPNLTQIRQLIHEVFLLTEEWEVANSLLAIPLQDALQKQLPDPEFYEILDGVSEQRNELCQWLFETVLQLKNIPVSHDFQTEDKTFRSLILAFVHKMYLPYSINKSKITVPQLKLFIEFLQACQKENADDISTKISLCALQHALAILTEDEFIFDESICKDLTRTDTFSWDFPFDPSHFLMGISWIYDEKSHLFYTTLCIYCYVSKNSQNFLSSQHYLQLEALLEAPQFFEDPLHTHIVRTPPIHQESHSQKIIQAVNDFLDCSHKTLNNSDSKTAVIIKKLCEKIFPNLCE